MKFLPCCYIHVWDTTNWQCHSNSPNVDRDDLGNKNIVSFAVPVNLMRVNTCQKTFNDSPKPTCDAICGVLQAGRHCTADDVL